MIYLLDFLFKICISLTIEITIYLLAFCLYNTNFIKREKTKNMLLLYNFRESIDSQWEKVNQEVSTVAEGRNLCF